MRRPYVLLSLCLAMPLVADLTVAAEDVECTCEVRTRDGGRVLRLSTGPLAPNTGVTVGVSMPLEPPDRVTLPWPVALDAVLGRSVVGVVVLGVLTLGRQHGPLPTPEERPILTAICDQIAVAVENTRLAAELRRLEARHEVQRMRSELISAVSHELRTPLGFIKSYATTLMREDTPIEPATRRHFLEIIDEETDKLDHMIDELLDASRLQAGRLPMERKPVALDALVTRAVDRARPALEASGHTVTLRLPDGDVPVLADPLRIEQVLDNLLENAARYSDPRSPVEVSLLAEDGHALVSVADRGDGVPAAELEQIFEPFYRGRNATRRGIRGAGLGLAICRGIMEAHGGKIWGEHGDDHVTTFVLTLPLARSQAV